MVGLTPVLMALLGGCAITEEGKGYALMEKMQYAEALLHMEKAAQQGSKRGAAMASSLYLDDYEIPLDIKKSRDYYALAQRLPYGLYDQSLDYSMPRLGALIQLNDDDSQNDKEAISVLRGDRYSREPSSLLVLGQAYAFGVGVEKNISTSKLLFERAIENDSTSVSRHSYAWWLAVHPDAEFRDGKLALKLMKHVMNDKRVSERPGSLDSLAAIYARNNMFKEAKELQVQALAALDAEIAKFPNTERLRPGFKCRLRSYESEKAWQWGSDFQPFGALKLKECEELLSAE